MIIDLDFVRAQFPAFAEPALRGRGFFENAGGSYTCRHSAWRLNRFYRERKVQPYGQYPASELAGAEMDEARERLARLLGVQTDEVSFGPSTTQNSYVLAQAFGSWLTEKQAIIVTDADHEANSGVWRRLADRGIEVREWKMRPETGMLETDDLEDLIDERVKLLCFPHASNVVGAPHDVSAICKIARENEIFTCVDGVSFAPHGLPNIKKMGADIYLFSAYKTYGPHQGIMVINRNLGMALPGQGHGFNNHVLYKRLTPAGPDHAQVAACAGIVDYFDTVYEHHFKAGRDATGRAESVAALIHETEQTALRPLMAYLEGRDDLRVLGPIDAQKRLPTVSVVVDGQSGADVARRLSDKRIMAGGGTFYADRALEALGVDLAQGVLRLSFVHYTSTSEVDLLIQALDQTL